MVSGPEVKSGQRQGWASQAIGYLGSTFVQPGQVLKQIEAGSYQDVLP